jgi:hypothetical protein
MQQRYPGAVVAPAALVEGSLEAGREQQLQGLPRQFRRAGRRIVEPVQRLGKAAEVVHGRRPRRGHHAHAAGHPVR